MGLKIPLRILYTALVLSVFSACSCECMNDACVGLEPVASPQSEDSPSAKPELEKIFFKYQSDLPQEADEAKLRKNADYLLSHTSAQIKLTGFSDQIGEQSQSKSLSKKRAEHVQKFLVKNGVVAERITLEFNGSNVPSKTERDAAFERRAQDRRVEFALVESKPTAATPAVTTASQLENIYFKYQSEFPQVPDVAKMKKNLEYLLSNANDQVILHAYSDQIGEQSQSESLSKKRAEYIKRYLVKNGIAAVRITLDAHGSPQPSASERDMAFARRQEDRRVEFEIKKQEVKEEKHE